MADMSGMEIDPATGLAKIKQPTLPYVADNNAAILPSVNNGGNAVAQPATPDTLAQGNSNVMAAAQNAALTPNSNGIQANTDAMVQKMQADPSFGYNGQQQKANQLSNYDYNQANAVQTFKNQNADLGGHGEINANLLKTLLQQNTDRSNLDNSLDLQNVDRAKKDWADAIAAGNTQQTTDSGVNSQNIQNMLNVRGAYEGERSQTQGLADNITLTNLGFDHATQQAATAHGYDLENMSKQYGNDMAKLMATQDFAGAQAQLDRDNQVAMQSTDIDQRNSAIQKQLDYNKWAQENGQTFTASQNAINNALQVTLKGLDIQGQTDLMNLKGSIDKGLMVTGQDFTATQNSLQRAADQALQQGNIQGQKDILAQKAIIDQQAQAAQNQFTQTLTAATQSWQTGERIGTEDANKQAQAIDIAAKQALQDNDIDAQKYLQTQSENLQLQLKTQDMDQETKMAYLNSELANAKADADVGRETQIIGFQTAQDLKKAVQQYGFERGMATLQGNIESALKDKDVAAASALQQNQLTFTAQENAANRALDQARIDLQGRQIDLQGQQMTFDQIEEGVKNGQIDPSAAVAAIKATAAPLGITIQSPDPNAAAKAALQQMDIGRAQFLATHPEYTQTMYTDKDGKPQGDAQMRQMYNAANGKAGANVPDPAAVTAWAQQNGYTIKDQQLSGDGLVAFNDYYNSTIYGEDGNGTADAAAKIVSNPSTFQGAATATNSNHKAYQTLLDNSQDSSKVSIGYQWDSKSNTRVFTSKPASGSFFSNAGALYMVTSESGSENHDGMKNTQYIVVQNVNTGTTSKIYCNNGPNISGQLPAAANPNR